MTGGWDEPRPLLIGIGSLLLVAAGVVLVIVYTLIVATLGGVALVLGSPIGLLGAADIVFGGRIRSARSRRPALAAAFLTVFSAPFILPIGALGLTVIVSAMFALVALIRHRSWFEPPSGEQPLAGDAPTPADATGTAGDEMSGSEGS